MRLGGFGCRVSCRSCAGDEAQDDAERDADNAAFGAACASMSPEDWDADNDWLASAGWGEM